MKLNPNCVRDVLIYLEDNLFVDLSNKNFKPIELKDLRQCLELREKYTEEEIWYAVFNLKEIKYIEGNIADSGSKLMQFCEIKNITWEGHQFLNTVRPQNIWDATLQGASKLGIMSMSALSTIAMEVAKAVVTNPTTIAKIISLL